MKTKTIGLRRSLLNEASASDLTRRYGLDQLTAAGILAANHAADMLKRAKEFRWQAWSHPEAEFEMIEKATECEHRAEEYRAFAVTYGAAYMVKGGATA